MQDLISGKVSGVECRGGTGSAATFNLGCSSSTRSASGVSRLINVASYDSARESKKCRAE